MTDDEEPPEHEDGDESGSESDHEEQEERGEPFFRFGSGFSPGFMQALGPGMGRLWGIDASWWAAAAEASKPFIEMPAFMQTFARTGALTSQWAATAQRITEEHTRVWRDLYKSFAPDTGRVFADLNRYLLPPNLRDHADEVTVTQVYRFLREEGIPLYLVPSGRVAVRLLRAEDHRARRKVLNDCYGQIIEDCADLLARADHEQVREEVLFVQDGLGAMKAGHTRSAQAIFTVTLDTLIARFYPEKAIRTAITSRKRGEEVPEEINSMGVREAMVWLPIWNAHEQFWRDKGDSIPYRYSRHASVHGVSKRQFSKRNCAQALMLVTSLTGYADALFRNGR
ncbi:hypothetical protein [Bogoriella caseilytica]|uniref:Uncharacterized protein n=1 Tax=Bogoriella caseilytica TaxID=56055 RepID=A0A3N2BGN8_9MICO|nr:hypothetical protein [Bogoriella caseilytica]ROR74429.1 hypothetical protein EDD31_2845 [Bogoriella caseilytica]